MSCNIQEIISRALFAGWARVNGFIYDKHLQKSATPCTPFFLCSVNTFLFHFLFKLEKIKINVHEMLIFKSISFYLSGNWGYLFFHWDFPQKATSFRVSRLKSSISWHYHEPLSAVSASQHSPLPEIICSFFVWVLSHTIFPEYSINHHKIRHSIWLSHLLL